MSTKEFAIAEVMPGQLNALVKTIMRQTGVSDPNEAVRLVNSREFVLTRPVRDWHKKEGFVYFTVTSENMTGEDWITWYKNKGIDLEDDVKCLLRSEHFKPTSGVTTRVVLSPGSSLLMRERLKIECLDEALCAHGYMTPNIELGFLMDKKFAKKEIAEDMGFNYITVMHDPVHIAGPDQRLVYVSSSADRRQFCLFRYRSNTAFVLKEAFAFAISEEQYALSKSS
ncbi:MAG: hypothetical protein WDZ88_03070 [Candidatus Paceibacterota bacterium]